MKTSSDFLDEVKQFYGLKSDYQLARLLKLTDSRISFYRTGKSRFDEDTCIQIAKLLNRDPGYVMACVSAERTKSDQARGEWERVARLLGGIAAVLAVVSCALLLLPAASLDLPYSGQLALAGFTGFHKPALYIMSNALMWANPLLLCTLAYFLWFSYCITCRPARGWADCEVYRDNTGE